MIEDLFLKKLKNCRSFVFSFSKDKKLVIHSQGSLKIEENLPKSVIIKEKVLDPTTKTLWEDTKKWIFKREDSVSLFRLRGSDFEQIFTFIKKDSHTLISNYHLCGQDVYFATITLTDNIILEINTIGAYKSHQSIYEYC